MRKLFLFSNVCFLVLQFTAANSWACGTGGITLTNLPTLGGGNFDVYGLNQAGQITGYSFTSGNVTAHAFRYSNGLTSDLGTLGGSVSQGFAINSSGQVAGDSNIANDLETHAALFNGGAAIDLGTLGGSYSSATAINDAGQVVGISLTAGDFDLGAFLYANGSMTDLGSLGGGFSYAVAINRFGIVAGYSYTADFDQHAFLYISGAMIDLGSLGSGYSSPFGLNDSGMVVGESALPNWDTHGFVYAAGAMQDIGTLGGTYSTATAVNKTGQVIGVSTTPLNARTHGFIWSSGAMTDLGTLGGVRTIPAAINNVGQVVGESLTAGGKAHAFLWQNGTMTDLNTQLPPNSGWELLNAGFINDSSRIVGHGLYQGVSAIFILDQSSANHSPVAVAGPNQIVECPAQVVLDGSGSSDPDGDSLTYEWSAAGIPLGTNVTLSGSFALGTNTVTLKVSDPCGASSEATVVVVVADTSAPVIVSGPALPTVSADATCHATVPGVVSQIVATDNCTATTSLVISQDPSAGALVGLGPHTIIVTVIDASGNSTTGSLSFSVVDSTPPVILSVPAPITFSADATCQTAVPNVLPNVVATDSCTPANQLVMTQSPVAGALVGLGQHTILVTVGDSSGNSATANVLFSVADTTAPVILSAPSSVTVSTDNNCQGAVPSVLASVVATDSCTSASQLVMTQSPVAGTLLGLGQHNILVTVRDSSGNSATANVLFSVADTTAPVILSAPSSVTVSADNTCQAAVPGVLASVVATDSCTPASQLVMSQAPAAGTILGHGQYTITVTVTDAAGNSASRNIPFTVADTTAPVFQSLSVSPNVFSPPNHQIVPVTVSATVSDNCDAAPFTRITSITSSEAPAPGDIQITGNLTASLAATRNPSGSGRIYTLTVKSTDASGNTATSTVTVTVPKGSKG